MAIRTRVIVAVLWVVSLLGVGAITHAQSQAREFRRLPEPRIMTGGDVGFRTPVRLRATSERLISCPGI